MTPHRRLASTVALALALALPASQGLAQPVSEPARLSVPGSSRPYQMQFDVRIPMRDGIELSAVVFRPVDQTEPLPVILTVTPYVSQRYEDVGAYFAGRGYVFVSVDSRGRGNSQGEFEPWSVEGADGYDAVEWLAAQPWADGQVAMWGGSYGGKNQWMIAGEVPPSLKTIVPVASGYMDYAVPGTLGIDWLYLIAGRTSNDSLRANGEFWKGVYTDLSRGLTTRRDLDSYIGYPNRYWQEWMDHPYDDEYWDAANISRNRYSLVNLPVLSITGQYDGSMRGTQLYRQLHLDANGPDVAARSFMVVGPWNHPGTRVPRRHLGGLDFGEQSVMDVRALHVAWYDHVMKGAALPEIFGLGRFVYYVSGADEWRSAEDIEAATGRREVLFLSSPTTTGQSLDEKGDLSPRTTAQQPDRYVYDPAAPAHNEGLRGGATVSPDFLIDDRIPRRLDGDGLIYDGPVLDAVADMVGSPEVELHLSMDVLDTDIQVIFYEVQADGRHIFLTQDAVRARHRASVREEILVIPGEVDIYRFQNFAFVGRTVQPGSRIRMVIVPQGASIWAPHNWNSGGMIADETPADGKVANVNVHLGPGASQVTLPWR